MAANAVQVSLNVIDEDGLTAIVDDDESQEGVTARGDGYCFGRKSVEDAIDAVREGKMVVVVDDMDRENEGDLIMAADACTPEDMAKIVRYSSGVICIAMDGERMDELGLPPMLQNNEDPKGTAFTVTVDATKEHGKNHFDFINCSAFFALRLAVFSNLHLLLFLLMPPQGSQLESVPPIGPKQLIY